MRNTDADIIYAPIDDEDLFSDIEPVTINGTNKATQVPASVQRSVDPSQQRAAIPVNKTTTEPVPQLEEEAPINVEIEAEPDLITENDEVEDVVVEEEKVNEEPEMVSKEEYDLLQSRYDQLMRDWDNYRKRTANEVAAAKATANKNLFKALLPTFDNFERALAMAPSDPVVADVVKGFVAINRSLEAQLAREGLVKISPEIGSAFDMNEQQAVDRRTDTDFAPDSVVDVLQAGYKQNGVVIRPALVAVSV